MSRKIKNILMIVLLLVLLGISGFTIYLGSNNESNMEAGVQDETGTPPDMPNDQNISENQNGSEDSDDFSSQPDLPEEGADSNSSDSNEPPEMPDGEGGQGDNMMQEPGGASSINETNNVTVTYYLLFGFESLGIALILLYLLMSKFNKKKLKETLSSKDKVVIYLLGTMLITIGLTFADSYIMKNLSFNETQTQTETSDNITYSAVLEITEDTELTSGEYVSTKADENGILATGDIDVSLENITIEKSGDSDGGDNTSFYGTNSALIAKSGATVVLENLNITTDATGANGVFSYGGSATTDNTTSDGTTVIISNSQITTTADNSGGIMTTGGGIMQANNLTINTSGISSAAIRTDRGGGTVTVDEGTYTTTGAGSPAVYSTADVTVSNATLISETAEGIVIEGKNNVTIDNCTLTDNNTELNGLSTTYKNIFLYQSMSGDAAEGEAEFTATDSQITTNNGDTFYVTNTSAIINLTNNEIVNNDSSGNFLRAKSDSWGSSGSNGGEVTLNLTNQDAIGNIVIDDVSTLEMNMTSSYFEGTINGDNDAKEISLTLDASSNIKLTGDSYVTSLDNADASNSNIDFNGYTLYVNGVAIN